MRLAFKQLVFLYALNLVFQSSSFGQSPNSIDDFASITRQFLELKRDLIITQNKLLENQAKDSITIYLDFSHTGSIDLQEINIELDGKQIAQVQLNTQETDILLQGGMKKIYSGPLAPGKHKLVAQLSAKKILSRYKPKTLSFDKNEGSETIKITLSDVLKTHKPDITFTIHEGSGQ